MTDPDFEGIWMQEGEDCLLAVSPHEGHYLLVYMDDGETSRFEGHLLRLGDFLFLDACPDEKFLAWAVDGQAYLPIMPAQFFSRIELKGGALKISLLGEDGLLEADKMGVTALAVQGVTDSLVITTTTAKLQGALRRLAPRDEFWDEPGQFRRVSR